MPTTSIGTSIYNAQHREVQQLFPAICAFFISSVVLATKSKQTNEKKIVAGPVSIPSTPYGKYLQDIHIQHLNPRYLPPITRKITHTFPNVTMPCANVLSLIPNFLCIKPSDSKYCPIGIHQCQHQESADRPEWEAVPSTKKQG